MARMALTHPVIVVPGITANSLRDEYPVSPEAIWTVLSKDYERAALHPDNLRYDAREPARVRADQLFEVAYKELIEELRFNLREREEQPVPVYPFAFDWRQPLDVVEQALAALVEEVIERTKLLPHYRSQGYADSPRVNLVGHSMGGLVIAGYLERAGANARVAKVATLATPFQGSFEAVIKVITGTANLGTEAPSSREREAARMTPALYHLMPSFENGITPRDRSLFEVANWQASVVDTIALYLEKHSVQPLRGRARRNQARELFAMMLDVARRHRERIDGFRLEQANLAATDWLCVVGVDAVTRVRLHITGRANAADFDLRSSDRQNLWEVDSSKINTLIDQKFLTPDEARQYEANLVALRRFTGDGTVPLEGAVPKFLALENLVCVSPDDYGYWEIADKVTTRLAGFHGILPNMDMLHRLLVRHLSGRPDTHGNTWGRPAPGVMDGNWQPPVLPLRNREAG
jgi:pimeloyl-ACP methyl ester carboxylesterase